MSAEDFVRMILENNGKCKYASFSIEIDSHLVGCANEYQEDDCMGFDCECSSVEGNVISGETRCTYYGDGKPYTCNGRDCPMLLEVKL